LSATFWKNIWATLTVESKADCHSASIEVVSSAHNVCAQQVPMNLCLRDGKLKAVPRFGHEAVLDRTTSDCESVLAHRPLASDSTQDAHSSAAFAAELVRPPSVETS
jgi:hypothetical protein